MTEFDPPMSGKTANQMTETSGFQALLSSMAQRSNLLVEQNVSLHDKNVDAHNAINERLRAIHENNVAIETGQRKMRALETLVRSFEDADLAATRARADFEV